MLEGKGNMNDIVGYVLLGQLYFLCEVLCRDVSYCDVEPTIK